MACLTTQPGPCRHDLEDELYSPRARLVHGDCHLVPGNNSHRAHSNRPLSHYINGDGALSGPCTHQHRNIVDSTIDRWGPYNHSSCVPQCGSLPHTSCESDYLDLPDPNWRFSYTYPLPCAESGSVRWRPDQIHAYNRDVLRHNNQIARRRNVGVSGECVMLHPMMDPLGRFPPGFDRPLALPEFFEMDEPLIDAYRQHYELPQPATLERLLLLSSAETRLRRQLKQIQLLELFGARRLAEQFAMQLLAAQNALPGLGPPRDLSYGLGPDFDDTYLSPLTRDYGGMVPLEAIGYGNGLANWDFNVLSQLIANRGCGSINNTLTSPLAITRPRSTPLYPGMGVPRGYSYPSSWSPRHHLHYPPYSSSGAYGGPWSPAPLSMPAGCGGGGGYFSRRTMYPNTNINMSISGGGAPSDNIHRVIEAISCDGGGNLSRRRKFN